MELTSERYSAKPAATSRWLTGRLALNWEVSVYVVILLLAIFTRFYQLGVRTMSHDESLHTKFSWDLYKNGVFAHTPLMHGPILFHATALNYFLFGDNDFTARIYPAVLGVLIVMFPLLFRRWLGRWGAILASILFLISPLILYYNRYIREDTPSIFYTLVMVYCTFMYLNGPQHLRRKARWLYIFSAAMLGSLGTKEVAFMYIAIFGSVLTLYWLARLGQHFYRMPGRSLFYFVSIAAMIGTLAALAMFTVLSIAPTGTAIPAGPGSLEFNSLISWSAAVIVTTVLIVVGTMLWAFGRNGGVRAPWLDAILMLALATVVAVILIYVEERSRYKPPADAGHSGIYYGWPLYVEWLICGAVIVGLLILARAGRLRALHRFPELDVLIVMGTLTLPWLVALVIQLMNPVSMMSMPDIATVVNAALPIKFDTSVTAVQIGLSFLPVLPALAVSAVVGLLWSPRRWLICLGIFAFLFLFFFTTVFTNINGIGTGLIGSLGYWLEQQPVQRGSQPQYYYLLVILPFYEFLPVIGSILVMIAGMVGFWRFRRGRLEERKVGFQSPMLDQTDMNDESSRPVSMPEESLTVEEESFSGFQLRKINPVERLTQVPFLIFVSWWVIFNLLSYTLAGEKMPWLGTHMTTPMIFLTGWYFGRFIERIEVAAFFKRNWVLLILLPILFVALVQLVSPFVVGEGLGGLEQVQLTRLFQWLAGFVIAGVIIYAIIRLIPPGGWGQFRVMVGAVVFIGLALLTFRSAWMASFINYDLPTEYLVYAHGGPANKRVMEQVEELSQRINGDLSMRFSYDFKFSWPGAWYVRNFANWRYLGENPSPPDMNDSVVVIVGDENRAAVETALEDAYYKFEYQRMWWPMQDYFGLTPQRVIDTFDLNNPTSAKVREGIWDIWWSRDYKTYGEALQRDFSLTKWPLMDHMYVFVRKDVAAQVWNLGVGNGTATNPFAVTEVNQCNANWQPLQANLAILSSEVPMNHPRQVAVGQDGRIYTADEFNHRIVVFNADGSLAFSFGQFGQLYQEGDPFYGKPNGPETGGIFNRPNGVAIGPSGNIYVADTWNYRVQVFTPEGEFVTSWGSPGQFGPNAPVDPLDGFWGPRAIVVDVEERVYVADTGNKRIRVYTNNGVYLRDIGSSGNSVGQLEEPSGITLSPDGLLYVADTWNRRISVFSQDGIPVTTFLSKEGLAVNSFRVRGWVDDQGNRPYVAVDAARKLVYVTDPDAGRVLVYGVDGNCLGSFGQLAREGPSLNQFTTVGGITTDAQGNVFVADAGSGRILRFDPFVLAVPVQIGAGVQEQGGVVETTAEVTPEVTEPVSG